MLELEVVRDGLAIGRRVDDNRASWFDEDESELPAGTGRRRLRILLAAAALPWLVVGALVLRPGALPSAPTPGPATVESDSVPDDSVPPDDAAWPDGPGHGDQPSPPGSGEAGADEPSELGTPNEAGEIAIAEIRGDWRLGPEDGDLAAIATVVARAWLTGMEPILPLDGIVPDPGGYAEHLVVDGIERPDAGAAVVTLTAVVLAASDDGFDARVRRVAVPLVVTGDGVRPAGVPWWLPEPDLDLAHVEVTPIDDPTEQLAAAEAIAAASYGNVELRGLGRTAGWAWVADVVATTPGGAQVDGPVWLRRHLGGFVVAGTPPPSSPPANGPPESDPPPAADEEVTP